MKRTDKAGRRIVIVFVVLAGPGMGCEDRGVDIPVDIYDEEGWNDAPVDIRVAALRRDVEHEMARLEALPPVEREPTAQRLLELMSALRAEWGKVDAGGEGYARLEAEVDTLLEG